MKLNQIAGKANANLYRHPKTGIIYLCISKVGKGRIERSTKTDNLTDARRVADEMKFKFLGHRNPKLGRKLNKELFPEWLKTKEIKSPGTYACYRLGWDHLKYFIEDIGPEDINETWWEGMFIPAKRAEAPKMKFFNIRKTTRMYLLAMQKQGLIDRLPDLIDPDPELKIGKVFTGDEIKRLLENSTPDLRLQILMAVTMGMRKSEILLLAIDRIDLKRKLISLKAEDTKIRKARTFAISETVWPPLEPRLGHPSGYVFPSATGENKPIGKSGNQTSWEGARKRAKVKGRFHDLRHTFLTMAFKTSTNPALICDYAGLSLEEAQATYLHFDHEDTRCVSGLVTL